MVLLVFLVYVDDGVGLRWFMSIRWFSAFFTAVDVDVDVDVEVDVEIWRLWLKFLMFKPII